MAAAASVATRPVFWHFVVWLKVLWYVLAVTSVVVFAYGVARPLGKYRHGQGGGLPPLRALPPLLWRGLRQLFSHVTIRRRDHTAGFAHELIFYGFVVLFAGTVVLGFDTDFANPVFGWNYFHGDFYLAYKETLNVLGTALIVGVLVMMFRRAFLRPAKLNYARPDRSGTGIKAIVDEVDVTFVREISFVSKFDICRDFGRTRADAFTFLAQFYVF